MGVQSSMYIGVSGLNSFSTALGVVSDNVANANTTAFKSSDVRFGDMVSSYYSTQSRDTDREGCGSMVLGIATDFGAGPIVNTNNWSDMTISGEGFFSVQVPNGGPVYYTRDGSFHVDKNGDLVNLQGYQVLDATGQPIHVDDPDTPVYKNFYVDADGQIYGTPVAGGDPVDIADGQVGVTTFPNQDGLIREGANLFSIGPEAGPGSTQPNVAGTGKRGTILDRALEGSNVDIASEMVSMIIYQADYNANTKSISTAAQMLDTIVNIVR